MCLSEEEEFEIAKEEVSRRMMEETLSSTDMQQMHFLCISPQAEQVYFEPVKDENGNIKYDSLGRPIYDVPPKYKNLHNLYVLLGNQVERTSNMSIREAELARARRRRLFLFLEAEQEEDFYEDDIWVIHDATEEALDSAIRDQIDAHRSKVLTVRKVQAQITSGTRQKRGGLFRR